jgi:hypothetical protein
MSTNNVLPFLLRQNIPFDIAVGTGGDNTRVGKTNLYEVTDHEKHYERDMIEVRETGCLNFRECIDGYKVQPAIGQFNFKEADRKMAILKDLGFVRTLDTLHHNNYTFLKDGTINPEFPKSCANYIQVSTERYEPEEVAPINEPFTNAIFQYHGGQWAPHRKGDLKATLRAMVNQAKAICLSTRALKLTATGQRIPNSVKTVHIMTCENHQALDKESTSYVEYRNAFKFLVEDLMFGLVKPGHPLYKTLIRRGITGQELEWFEKHPAIIDVIGINYYFFHEQQWKVPKFRGDAGWIRPSKNPIGFAAIASQIWHRFMSMLSSDLRPTELRLMEFNIRGTIFDRISATKHIGEECWKLLKTGIPITQMNLYPDRDQMCWSTECTKVDTRIDGHGMIFWMDEDKRRHHSLLSHYFSLLTQGKITPHELPAFRFQDPVDQQLEGFMPFMSHWNWQSTEYGRTVAHSKKYWPQIPAKVSIPERIAAVA